MNHKKQFLKIKAAAVALVFFCFHAAVAQQGGDQGTINGNFQINVQNYFEDTLIGTLPYPEQVGANSFLYLTYTRGRFQTGIRFESYLPTLQGFLRERGSGIAHRFVSYQTDRIDVRFGNFYEQFGSGMVLRTYEEWGLGFDNSIDGARVKFRPIKGIEVTGLVGRQRNAFTFALQNMSQGLVRGVDADLSLNEFVPGMDSMKTKIKVGGSFVSRFQEDNDPILILPENVATYGARLGLTSGKVGLNVEYVGKINDPSTVNGLIYKPGNGLLVQATYSQKGLGVSFAAKRIDNMDFRSERSATFNNLNLNFLPPSTKQHTYRLLTLFPYATQPNGELGLQAEVLYKFKRESPLGGKYGTTVSVNFSHVRDLDKTPAADPDMGYESNYFGWGDRIFFQDFNIEISKKFSKKFKGVLTYMNVTYDKSLFTQLTGFSTTEIVHSHVAIVEGIYKVKRKHTLRSEVQHAYTQQEFGSWAMLLVEYSIAPHWFVAVFDEYNYGNADPKLRLHYYTGQFGYAFKQYRFTAGYGRQRAGVLCVGGVCRVVPAANGFSLSIMGSF